ncbi:MAG: hypothetical protein ABIK68_20305 [bacterium]
MSNRQTACAWDLELGIHHLMPKLWTGEQRYENSSGSTLKFKPVIQKTITGQSVSVGLFWENLLIQIEQAIYRYETEIPASNIAVMNDTMARFEVTEQRLGISYHLERELAGVYAGIGMTREKEKIVTSSDEWQFEADVPYFKFGIDIILGAWRVRVEQIHYSFGKHSAKVGSLGILLHL